MWGKGLTVVAKRIHLVDGSLQGALLIESAIYCALKSITMFRSKSYFPQAAPSQRLSVAEKLKQACSWEMWASSNVLLWLQEFLTVLPDFPETCTRAEGAST